MSAPLTALVVGAGVGGLTAALALARAGLLVTVVEQAAALGDEGVKNVVAYVRTLSPGHELFGVYCASCHGEDGRGSAVAAAEGDRWLLSATLGRGWDAVPRSCWRCLQ